MSGWVTTRRVGSALTLGACWLASACAVPTVEGPYQLGRFDGPAPRSVEHLVVAGELDGKDSRGERSHYEDVYTFAGWEGEQLTIELRSSTVDCYLFLYDDAGTIVDSDDDSADNLDSRITTALPRTGRYRIGATSYSQESGSYQLRVVRELAPRYPLISGDASSSFSLDTPSDLPGAPYRAYAIPPGDGTSRMYVSASDSIYLDVFDFEGVELMPSTEGDQLTVPLPRGARFVVLSAKLAPGQSVAGTVTLDAPAAAP